MSSERQNRWISRYPWRASGVMGIVALGVGGLLFYIRDSIRTSNIMRVQAELQRNMLTAQLGATMLDDLPLTPSLRRRGNREVLARREDNAALRALQGANRADGSIYVINDNGHVYVANGEAIGTITELGEDFEPLQLARKRANGVLTLFPPIVSQRMLVGYAVAARSGLVVIVLTPAEHALVPMRFLMRRIGVIIAPALVIVLLAAWVLVTYYDKQQKLADQLVEHNARLRDADCAKSDFLANVSHDLRTPLASLRVSLNGLLDPDVLWDDGEVKGFLQTANEQVDQLSARVRNLLDMARVESDRQVIHKETCDLTDIAASAIERLRPQLRGRQIVTDFPEQPLFVECDQVQIGTVILNLLENAAKYAPEYTPLTIKGAIHHPYATLTVCDAGLGIAPEDVARVFDKFYRSRSVASIGGTGLGLTICKTIIEQHGGLIGVRNGLHGGAEFWFSLPVPFIDMTVDSIRGMIS